MNLSILYLILVLYTIVAFIWGYWAYAQQIRFNGPQLSANKHVLIGVLHGILWPLALPITLLFWLFKRGAYTPENPSNP